MRRTDLRVAFGAAVAFAVLTVLVAAGWGPLARLDAAVAAGANSFAETRPTWVHLLRLWATVAGPLPWRVFLALLAGWLLLRRRARAAAFALAAAVAGSVLSTAFKLLLDRPRPPHPYATAAGMAFPSGHATMSAVGCGVLLLLVSPAAARGATALARTLAVLVPLSVGYTRIGLDVHWFSDVLGGWLLGVAVVAAAAVLSGVRAPPRSTPASPEA